MMQQFINPIENSLLQELVDLYSDDLLNEEHHKGHTHCPVCSKQLILCAIRKYRELERLQPESASKQVGPAVVRTSFQSHIDAVLNSP
jgi:hypothetical protein